MITSADVADYHLDPGICEGFVAFAWLTRRPLNLLLCQLVDLFHLKPDLQDAVSRGLKSNEIT